MLVLVSCIKRHADAQETEYFLVTQDGKQIATRSARSKLLLNLGEMAEAEIKDGWVTSFDALEGKKEKENLEKQIAETVSALVKGELYKIGNPKVDEATKKMWKRLEAAMQLFVRKIVIGAPIVIRFHNDIDGASGAYALHTALKHAFAESKSIRYEPNVSWRMHGSVSYSREDATTDALTCNAYECVEKPLLLITDFGTSEESNPGIELAEGRFDLIWLDHHPMTDKFAGKKLAHYINTWNFGTDSNYTAGFLTCMFAKALANVDTKDIEEASFIGDYSEYSKPTAGSRRIAALLDLLTSDTRVVSGLRGSLNPETIESVLKDKGKSDELIAYAENRVAEMLDLAIKSVKIYKAGSTQIYVADFEALRINEQERYPLPGRFASRLLGKIEETNKTPCILMLHFGHFVSVRMSKELIKKVNLLKALEQVRSDYSNYVDSTGGHSNAASIKLKTDEMKKEVIKSAVDKLKAALDSGTASGSRDSPT